MDQHELNALKRWFTDYCGSFYSLNREDQRNIALKEEHTRNVCGNIVQIARTLSLDEARIKLAEESAPLSSFRHHSRMPSLGRQWPPTPTVGTNRPPL